MQPEAGGLYVRPVDCEVEPSRKSEQLSEHHHHLSNMHRVARNLNVVLSSVQCIEISLFTCYVSVAVSVDLELAMSTLLGVSTSCCSICFGKGSCRTT